MEQNIIYDRTFREVFSYFGHFNVALFFINVVPIVRPSPDHSHYTSKLVMGLKLVYLFKDYMCLRPYTQI